MNATPLPPAADLTLLTDEIELALGRSLRGLGCPDLLEEAMCYAALGGGKRIRPTLVLMAAEAAGGAPGEALEAAVAIELVHNFSLVHDDLPAMDDDALRRGRPTLHVKAGEAMAVLAGDGMLAAAFRVLAASDARSDLRVRMIDELSEATLAMIAGQVHDTLGGLPHELTDAQRLLVIHRNKTGALLRSAVRLGGIAVDAAPEVLTGLSHYGDAIGLMFQIVDDLIDVTQTAEHTGKSTGKDASAGKLTYPGVFGIAKAKDEVTRLENEAEGWLAPFGESAEPLRQLARSLAIRTR